MVLDAAVLDGGRREVLWDVDEDAGFMGANLVDEDRGIVAKEDVAMIRLGKVCIDQFQAPEPGADLGSIGMVLLAEFGGVAIGHHRKMAKVAILHVAGHTLDTKNLLGVGASDQVGGLGLHHCDIGTGQRSSSQLHDEAAMVETTPLRGGRRRGGFGVGERDGFPKVCHMVAFRWDGINVFETISKTQFLKRLDTARL